jgi:hypothetical protein
MAAAFAPPSAVMAAHAAVHVLLCLPRKGAAKEKKDVAPRIRGDDVESGSDSTAIGMSRAPVGLAVPGRTGR